MGVDICKLKYKTIKDHVSEKEIQFIENHFSQHSDFASYYITKEAIDNAIESYQEPEEEGQPKIELTGELKDLIKVLRQNLKGEKWGGYDIQIS